jgi:ubiquinone/menaquinone biosynthesis C-methylase UbiE
MFEHFYPMASPQRGDRVLEVGSGVGWIMQATAEGYPDITEVVGLDISENMIKRAQERWTHPLARWVLYDGMHFPFEDDHFDVVYSCAALQHVEKHHAFFIFKEIDRVLKPGGHAVLHLLYTAVLSHNSTSFEEECRNHIENRRDAHWHHFYSYDELVEVFGNVLRVDDLDIRLDESISNLYVHFSKGTGRRFLRKDLPYIAYPYHVERLLAGDPEGLGGEVLAARSRLREIETSRAWRLASALRSAVRRLAPVGSRRGNAVTALGRSLSPLGDDDDARA